MIIRQGSRVVARHDISDGDDGRHVPHGTKGSVLAVYEKDGLQEFDVYFDGQSSIWICLGADIQLIDAG